jgi:hypothetical protein
MNKKTKEAKQQKDLFLTRSKMLRDRAVDQLKFWESERVFWELQIKHIESL